MIAQVEGRPTAKSSPRANLSFTPVISTPAGRFSSTFSSRPGEFRPACTQRIFERSMPEGSFCIHPRIQTAPECAHSVLPTVLP